jgi:hypothetical protein
MTAGTIAAWYRSMAGWTNALRPAGALLEGDAYAQRQHEGESGAVVDLAEHVYLFNGEDLERWMLEGLCELVNSGSPVIVFRVPSSQIDLT